MVKVLIKKLDPNVKLPEYKTDGASGMDLKAFVKKPINVMQIENLGKLTNIEKCSNFNY